MDLYPIAKLLHVASAMVWAGGLAGLLITGMMEARTGAAGTLAAARRAAAFARIVVGPAALVTIVFGGAMVYMVWSFLDLWILMALTGFVATFLVDAVLIGRLERRLSGPEDGAPSPERLVVASRILRAAGFDLLVLGCVLVAMVLKPGAGDVGVVAALAIACAAGAILLLRPRRGAKAASA